MDSGLFYSHTKESKIPPNMMHVAVLGDFQFLGKLSNAMASGRNQCWHTFCKRWSEQYFRMLRNKRTPCWFSVVCAGNVRFPRIFFGAISYLVICIIDIFVFWVYWQQIAFIMQHTNLTTGLTDDRLLNIFVTKPIPFLESVQRYA